MEKIKTILMIFTNQIITKRGNLIRNLILSSQEKFNNLNLIKLPFARQSTCSQKKNFIKTDGKGVFNI